MKQIIFKSLVVRSFAFIMLIMCTVSASAQYYMNVYKNNGQKYQFLVSDIDSVGITQDIINNLHNGYEYVDLGLPSGLKWATCNVGAESPEDYGDYFAWGETESKSNYSWSTYKHCNSGSSSKLTKYNVDSSWGTVDNITTLELEDDAAHVNWGGAWRMPTYNDWNELKNNCAWTWTTLNGVKGYKVVSKSNGNSIFLPAAGYFGTSVGYAGSFGVYWFSSLGSSDPSDAYYLLFGSDSVDWYNSDRCIGHSVRAVCLDTENIPTSYTISFNANGGEGEMSQIISSAENLTLPANAFTYEGYEFTGWNTNADGSGTSYSNEQSITVAENIVLYAQWKEILIEAEDQVFIGVVAFNKMVNLLPITSNLEKVKSFITTQKNDYDFTAFAYSVSKGNLMFDAEGLPEFDNIFMLNFSDGTDNYSNMLWGNENRMIPLANVYDTVQYDLTGRQGLNSYALGFGNDVGFSSKMQKVVTGKGGYYNAKSSADLQTTFNDIAESIIASSQNVVLQTNPGYYSEIMGYKYFRFIFEADGIKDTLDAKMEGMPNTGYTLTVMRSTNNYAHFDEPAIGTIDETTGKVKIPLNNLTFTYEGEELQYEYEILFSPDDDQYYVDVEEASTSEDIAKRIAVVIVLDCSTSMGSAFEPMKDAANDFIDILEGMISEPRTDSLYVSFNANGGEGDMANIEFVKGETVTVSINTFTRVGYKFIGWNTKADGTGLSYTENEPVQYLRRNLKLYAQWEYDPYNGYEYVDLGLPSGLKWATCNVGAYSPETYGSYFAWGETEPKSNYSWSTYKHCNNGSSSQLTKYNVGSSWGTVDNTTTLELEDDAAHVNWGGAWRMPTYNDWTELINNCTRTWTTLNGVSGYKLVSKSNGNSIFLPAAGYRNGTSVYSPGSYGYYWSSSLYSGDPDCAYYLYDVHLRYSRRYYGHSVRAVCP